MGNELKVAGLRHSTFLLAFAAFWICFTMTSGCRSINPLPTFGVGDASPEEVKIRKLMEWHSGRVEVYREFRTVFTARAVYLSNDIQEMAADWEARSKLMDPEERAEFEDQFLEGENPVIKVLVGFYTPREEQNDLSSGTSAWITYLKHSDGSVTRATCLDVDEENTRIYMRFLKWDLSWSKLYLLCFPSSPDPSSQDQGSITLVISGPGGAGEIRLQTSPPADQP
jgi:hypothetical protein